MSTRAKALPQPMPDFDKLHKSEHCPHYRDTVSAQLRRACVEEQVSALHLPCVSAVSPTPVLARRSCVSHPRARSGEQALKAQLKKRRAEQREAKRLAALREVSVQVTKTLGGASSEARRAQQREQKARQRERFMEENREKQRAADERLAQIHAKVANRPFLFQRQAADAASLRAKQEQYDKFGAIIREHGLGDLLEKLPA